MNTRIDEPVLLDTEHLGKYTLGDEALEREVLQMFLDQSALYMERLENPESTGDWQETAHALKGCAHAIGAFRVGMRAARLEKMAEPLKTSVRCAVLALLQKDIEETRAAILDHIGKASTRVFV